MAITADQAAELAKAHGLSLADARALAVLADDVEHGRKLASTFGTDDAQKAPTMEDAIASRYGKDE